MEFLIENVKVFGLEESLISSGYPKTIDTVSLWADDFDQNMKDRHKSRGVVLGHAKAGSGHDCYLKGIIVQWDITATHAFWIQYLRYHFSDIISSQSKMHKITNMNLRQQSHKLVLPAIIAHCEIIKADYLETKSQEDFERLIYNLPMGLMLTARCTDNYLSLKTQYQQRKTDKLSEWHEYCKEIEYLPMFKELVL